MSSVPKSVQNNYAPRKRQQQSYLAHAMCKKASREDEGNIDNINDFVNGVSSYGDDSAEIDFDQIKCKVCRGDREDVLIECDSHTCSNWAL